MTKQIDENTDQSPRQDEEIENEETVEEPQTTEPMRILEALLFASEEPLAMNRLKTLMPEQPDARTIKRHIAELNQTLQRQRHPFEIVEIGGGYQFRTVSYYQPWLQQLFKEKSTKKLSMQALECLAIIAYRQPITKAEIESIRGVMSDGAMKTLLERHLITPVGRSEKPGRPLLYGSAPEFLSYFGLNKISDLPSIEEFEAMAREKEFTEEELQQIESAMGLDKKGQETQEGETQTEAEQPRESRSEQGESEATAAPPAAESEADVKPEAAAEAESRPSAPQETESVSVDEQPDAKQVSESGPNQATEETPQTPPEDTRSSPPADDAAEERTDAPEASEEPTGPESNGTEEQGDTPKHE